MRPRLRLPDGRQPRGHPIPGAAGLGAGLTACTHDPACPASDAIDWWAARSIAEQPGQGWTLLCNGALVFDDHGALLPDGRVAAISDVPHTRLCSVA